jgi:hypothetical protein
VVAHGLLTLPAFGTHPEENIDKRSGRLKMLLMCGFSTLNPAAAPALSFSAKSPPSKTASDQ